jgi:peptidoglycan/xylan/chitin deacetylase (PgdA/CDA1 family)
MRLVSPLLKRAIYPALHHVGFFGRITPTGCCAVVNYHGVVPGDYSTDDTFLDGNLVQLEALRQQLVFLKTHYRVLHPEDFRAWIEDGKKLPPRSVLVTCDDGLLNTLTDMLPVLQSESVPCLFFVTGASCSDNPGRLWYEDLYHLLRTARALGKDVPPLPANGGDARPTSAGFQSQWWDMVTAASRLDAEARTDWINILRNRCDSQEAFHSQRRWRLLNLRELRQVAGAGIVIGGHTMTHPVLAQCSEQEARREIQDCKTEIERALGMRVWAFAYPFGNPSTMGEREFRLAREAGFTCAFMNVGSGSVDRCKPLELCRTHISADMSLAEFEAHLVGFHARLQRAVRG